MATYQAPFQREAISEVVPRSLELSSLSKSSLLTGRRRIRVIPQTGQTYGAATGSVAGQGKPTLANILLQDSAGLLDMQSVVLSMNVRTQIIARGSNNAIARKDTGQLVGVDVNPYAASLGAASATIDGSSNAALPNSGGAAPVGVSAPFDVIDLASDNDPLATCVLDDFVWSVFRRIQISLNSQLVDDLDYAGRRATTEVYQSASPSWYDTVGTVMGSWKLAQGEFVQPSIAAPVSALVTPSTGPIQAVSTFPVKSRVQAYQWANYCQQLGVYDVGNAGDQTVPGFSLSAASVADGANITLDIAQGVAGGWYDLAFNNSGDGQPNADLLTTAFLTVTPPSVPGGPSTYAWTNGGADEFINPDDNTRSVELLVATAASAPPGIAVGQMYIASRWGPGSNLAYTVTARATRTAKPLVVPTAAMGQAYINATQVSASGAVGWLDSGVGQLHKLGHTWVTPGSGSLLPNRPLCLGPEYTASVARTDVLSKLYATSMFMKDVFFGRNAIAAPTNGVGAAHPPIVGTPSLEAVALNSGSKALWVQRQNPQGPKFSVPMGLLSHLFRQEQLFPLRNAGQLIIQIQFADALECCYAGFLYPKSLQVNAANLAQVDDNANGFDRIDTSLQIGYEVQNLELECDIVTAIPEYTAILDAICSRPADKGLAIAFDSHLTSLQQVSGLSSAGYGSALGNGSSQTFTLIASKGSENVRSFTWTFTPSAGLRSPYYMQNSTFPAYNIEQWQLRVGSVYYPAFPSKGLSKNYMEMLSAMNAPMPSVGQASLVNYNMFRQSTPSYDFFLGKPNGWIQATQLDPSSGQSALETFRYDPKAGVFADLKTNSSLVTGGIIPAGQSEKGLLIQDPATSYMSDGYIGSYCFDNLKHAEPLSHDGIDTRAIAGGMIQLDFTCQPIEAFAVVFHIRFTRTIVLAENGVSIVG